MPKDGKKSVLITKDAVQQAKARQVEGTSQHDSNHGQGKPRFKMSRRRTLFAGTLLLVGIVLLSYQPVINHIVGPHQLEKAYVNHTPAETIQKNIERYESLDTTDDTIDELFDYESVKMITTLDINPTIQSENVIGGLYVPSVELNIPIMYGVTQDVLSSSAGTMRPEQEMGVGNYPIIGHNSKNPNVLFAPIHRIDEGDKMYVTDKQGVYEYDMTVSKIVEPSEIEVIDDVDGVRLLTLISCTADGKQRIVVQGELVAVHMYDVAPTDVLKVFNDL